jgi:hypothetical protein
MALPEPAQEDFWIGSWIADDELLLARLRMGWSCVDPREKAGSGCPDDFGTFGCDFCDLLKPVAMAAMNMDGSGSAASAGDGGKSALQRVRLSPNSGRRTQLLAPV